MILGPIGAGGMGEVYRARDSRLDRDVALKLLPPHGDRSRFQIYFLRRTEDASAPGVMVYSFATQQLTRIARLDRPFALGVSVFPDRRWLAFAGPADSAVPASDVMMVENFR